ncbi:MAG: tRNA (N(6)-L-threonylcarbamoyladenosine(37)-C(2))-methylthiotransferase MtaB [Pirellulales bacterium]|nr:tRNA (N(6)-L-threonylcarbamoyladenosine(37)-C(2))-methylthiotransferase MtaB [Pirellulales bacterium]
MAPALRTVTLGCKVNQYETEYVRQGLLGIGYRDALVDEPAALCIVNTCTVTAQGDSKSRQIIRQLARRNPAARIVVMGCYATRAPDELAALPGVTEVVTDKRELPDLLGRFGVVDVPRGISSFGSRHRAYVKVQDGCLLRCTFCIIPLVRPAMYSRPAEGVLDEVRRLVDAGYRELVLTGIHLGHYGVDQNRGRAKHDWLRLSTLLERIARLPGEFRVRLSSIEATEVTRELVAAMAEHPRRICPHLHVSMQSGSDAVLARMRRRWGSRRFVDRCRLVQAALDRPALTTDVIVGFPGESDDDFAATCRVVEEIGFSKIHIFPFSPRRGTPAADMADQIAAPLKAERVRRLGELERHLRRRYFKNLLGRQLEALLEAPVEAPVAAMQGIPAAESGSRQSWLAGTTCRYAPIRVRAPISRLGELVKVRAIAFEGNQLVGETLADC